MKGGPCKFFTGVVDGQQTKEEREGKNKKIPLKKKMKKREKKEGKKGEGF
jgi:hypothetical protein